VLFSITLRYVVREIPSIIYEQQCGSACDNADKITDIVYIDIKELAHSREYNQIEFDAFKKSWRTRHRKRAFIQIVINFQLRLSERQRSFVILFFSHFHIRITIMSSRQDVHVRFVPEINSHTFCERQPINISFGRCNSIQKNKFYSFHSLTFTINDTYIPAKIRGKPITGPCAVALFNEIKWTNKNFSKTRTSGVLKLRRLGIIRNGDCGIMALIMFRRTEFEMRSLYAPFNWYYHACVPLCFHVYV